MISFNCARLCVEINGSSTGSSTHPCEKLFPRSLIDGHRFLSLLMLDGFLRSVAPDEMIDMRLFLVLLDCDLTSLLLLFLLWSSLYSFFSDVLL